MGGFYSGFGGYKSFLGHCDDGIIYSGSGNRTPIGRYENGNVYNQFKELVGSYSGGSIYDAYGTHIASYDGGSVYNKYLNVAVGKGQVGSYDGNPAEAAALVLLFLGGNAVNGDDEDRDIPNPEPSSTPSPSGDSGTGCLSALFGLVILLFAKVLWPIIKLIFVYFCIPNWVAMTWLMFLPAVFVSTGIIPLAIASAILAALCYMAFWPYGIMVIVLKFKKQITTKEQLSFYGKWFLKGPVAYVDLVDLMNKTNTLPRVAKFYSKRIEFFKKIFKKK